MRIILAQDWIKQAGKEGFFKKSLDSKAHLSCEFVEDCFKAA